MESDTAVAAGIVGAHFADRWGGSDPDARWALLENALAADGQSPEWTAQDITEAATALRHGHAVDSDGLCPHAVLLAALQAPEATAAAFRELASETSLMSLCTIRARALGKRTSLPTVEQVRDLLPQGTLMGILDVLLSRMVHAVLGALPPLPLSVVEGCRPGASASDLALSARLVVQHALDRRSEGAAGQGDIRQFYDHVPVPRCVEELRAWGLPPPACAAVVRHQLLPLVELRVGPSHMHIRVRSSGCLMGSRLAGALGRVVVRTLLAGMLPAQSSLGFAVGPARTLLAATCMDNLIVFGRDATGVEAVLAWAQGWLREHWAVDLADSSLEVLVPVGSEVPPTEYRPTVPTRGALARPSLRCAQPPTGACAFCATLACRFTPNGGS